MTGWRPLVLVVVLLGAYAAGPGTGPWVASVGQSAAQLYRFRNAGPDSRAMSLLGEPWRLVDDARAMTPPDARILIPEGRDADPVSNRIWCAYYLYPRRLVRFSEINGPLRESVDVVLVYRGHNLEHLGVPADSIRGTETAVVDLRAR